MDSYSNLKSVEDKKLFWSRNPLQGEVEIRLPFCPSFKMYCENDDTVVKELYWTDFRGWELTSLKLWQNLANKAQEGLVLDIGSYSGIYSLIAKKLSPKIQVVGFDIQKKCIDRVKKNFDINGFNDLHTVMAACSNQEVEIPFYFYEEKDILSSVASIVPKKINDQQSMIQAIRIDNYLAKNFSDQKVKLIKMDVEDAEYEAVSGLQQCLENHQPDVLIEINNPRNVKKVFSLFPKNYKFYSIDDENNKIKKLSFWFKGFSSSRNYLATCMPQDPTSFFN